MLESYNCISNSRYAVDTVMRKAKKNMIYRVETYSIVRSNKIRETDRDDYEIDEVELSRDV